MKFDSNSQPLVVITGASAGIGAATALRFAKENFRLVLIGRRLDRLKALQNKIKKPSLVLPLDITEKESVVNAIKGIEDEHGEIEILVNNAGAAFGLESADQANLEDWEKCVDINIKGLLYCTHAVLPSMVRRKKGHIINLGSVAGTYPYPGGNVYGATKSFVHQLSLNLRADLLETGIRISCIEPGLVGGTEFSIIRFRGDEKKASKTYEDTSPLTPEDIAEIIFFCHSLPSHVNVNTIEVMPVGQAFSPLAVHRARSIPKV